MSPMLPNLPNYSAMGDGQFIEVNGPDGVPLNFQYDAQQRAFYFRTSTLAITGKHGANHVGGDLIPTATTASPGLLSADDKCKLDAITGTRLGVLGFVGAGFPDDGGWMQGDIILAAGSEAISLERVGNVVRFTVDVPVPFNCGCEECFKIYWVQDTTDTSSIRPPACAGRVPDVNMYGELKVYVLPENAVINQSSPDAGLNAAKTANPSLIFKRYSGVREAQLDVVLKRSRFGVSEVGWSFTPGTTGSGLSRRVECKWFLGTDTAGNGVTFEFQKHDSPGVLGALIYGKYSVTKRPAIITGYDSNVLTNNIYKAKWRDLNGAISVGSEFSVRNVSRYDGDSLVSDGITTDLLPVGKIVDVTAYLISGTSYRYFIMSDPQINTEYLWATSAMTQFGDIYVSTTLDGVDNTDDFRNFERAEWGMTGLPDPLRFFSETNEQNQMNHHHAAHIISRSGNNGPGLSVLNNTVVDSGGTSDQKPIFLWHRGNHNNAIMEIHLARPTNFGVYPPIDVLLHAPIDSFESKYAYVTAVGQVGPGYTSVGGEVSPYDGYSYIKITGVGFHEIPPRGIIRRLYNIDGGPVLKDVAYIQKFVDSNVSSGNAWQLVLLIDPISTADAPVVGDAIELMHEDMSASALRLQFTETGEVMTLQAVAGLLNVGMVYDLNAETSLDDDVREFDPSFRTTSALYSQTGSTDTGTSGFTSSVDGFIIYDGKIIGSTEYYNVLKLMVIEDKLWVWWNGLLLPPNSSSFSTPYYPIFGTYGKLGLRLWPGAVIRRVVIKDALEYFSQYTNGQLQIV